MNFYMDICFRLKVGASMLMRRKVKSERKVGNRDGFCKKLRLLQNRLFSKRLFQGITPNAQNKTQGSQLSKS